VNQRKRNISRRDFLGRTRVAASSALVRPMILPSRIFGADGAGERAHDQVKAAHFMMIRKAGFQQCLTGLQIASPCST